MSRRKIYPSSWEIQHSLEELLFQAATTQRVVAAELERRGVAVQRSAELEARLQQFERKREQRNG